MGQLEPLPVSQLQEEEPIVMGQEEVVKYKPGQQFQFSCMNFVIVIIV